MPLDTNDPLGYISGVIKDLASVEAAMSLTEKQLGALFAIRDKTGEKIHKRTLGSLVSRNMLRLGDCGTPFLTATGMAVVAYEREPVCGRRSEEIEAEIKAMESKVVRFASSRAFGIEMRRRRENLLYIKGPGTFAARKTIRRLGGIKDTWCSAEPTWRMPSIESIEMVKRAHPHAEFKIHREIKRVLEYRKEHREDEKVPEVTEVPNGHREPLVPGDWGEAHSIAQVGAWINGMGSMVRFPHRVPWDFCWKEYGGILLPRINAPISIGIKPHLGAWDGS